MEHYEAHMTQERIKADKNFDFLFDNTSTLFAFLSCSFNDLVIKEGNIAFMVEVPIGKITRKMELTIPTEKKEVDEGKLRELRFSKIQLELDALKEENAQLKEKMHTSEEQMAALTEVFKKFERTL
jgi:hypothetical protein